MKRALMGAGVALCLLSAAMPARAQTGTARGKVVDEKGEGVAEVKVSVDYQGDVKRHFETKSNKKGEFTQVGLQPGVYRFTPAKDGYQAAPVDIKINLGDPTIVPDLKLVPKGAAGPAGAGGGGGDKSLGELKASVDKAIQLTNAGNFDEAEAIYKDAIAKNPQMPQLYNNLAVLYLMKKDNASAEANFRKALEARPDYPEALVGLTRLYLGTGQRDKANEVVSQALKNSPEDAQLNLQAGIVYFDAGRTDDAAAALKKAQSLDPSLAEAYFYLGSIAVGQGKTDECIANMEKYLSMSPTNRQNIQTAQGLIAALKKK